MLIPKTIKGGDILWTCSGKEVVQNCSKVNFYSVSLAWRFRIEFALN
jgi:hypothetical protein